MIEGASFFNVETGPSMLVISSRPVDCRNYISAASGLRFGPDPRATEFSLALNSSPRLRK